LFARNNTDRGIVRLSAFAVLRLMTNSNFVGCLPHFSDLSGKRLELLAEVVPELSRVGVLRNPDEPTGAMGFKDYEAAARALKIRLLSR